MSVESSQALLTKSTESSQILPTASTYLSQVKSLLSPTKTLYIDYQNKYTFEKRLEESSRTLHKYPDRIPIICEIVKRDRDLIELIKHKFLVPKNITVGAFLHTIRKQILYKTEACQYLIPAEMAIFMFTENNSLPTVSATMSSVYTEHKNKDGLLYFTISLESVYG